MVKQGHSVVGVSGRICDSIWNVISRWRGCTLVNDSGASSGYLRVCVAAWFTWSRWVHGVVSNAWVLGLVGCWCGGVPWAWCERRSRLLLDRGRQAVVWRQSMMLTRFMSLWKMNLKWYCRLMTRLEGLTLPIISLKQMSNVMRKNRRS